MLNSPDSARCRAIQRYVITAFLALVLTSAAGKPVRAGEAPRIEVFVSEEFLPPAATQEATVYVIDGLSRIETGLSRELPGDSRAAKALVLERFARMEAGPGRSLENAARGLARAMHYGIDRYPAIVFDGQTVVYGIPDIDAASRIWRRWKKAQASQ